KSLERSQRLSQVRRQDVAFVEGPGGRVLRQDLGEFERVLVDNDPAFDEVIDGTLEHPGGGVRDDVNVRVAGKPPASLLPSAADNETEIGAFETASSLHIHASR